MNITAETLESEIMKASRRARATLAEKAVEYATESATPEGNDQFSGNFYLRGEELRGLAQNVYTAETLMQAQLRYLRVCRTAPNDRLEELFDIAVGGAADTFSGRSNDSRRSAFDAVRSWATDQASRVRYES